MATMIKKIKVKSPANIAFIKYWGQKNQSLVLPFNDSFSMNLSSCFTIIEFEVYQEKTIRKLYIKDYQEKSYKEEDEALRKVINYLKIIERFFSQPFPYGFKIYSSNSFPKKAGIASSASFFSALALAFSYFFNKKLSLKQLSILARLSGSGSACRSIPDGFCWWKKGNDSFSSYAYSLASPDFWQIFDLVLILSRKEKKVSSAEGHQKALTSPFFKLRLLDLEKRTQKIKKAFLKKDFTWFGTLLEEEALSMHFIMMTQKPPLFYWSGKTIEIIKKVITLRQKGIEVYFTIDAGENVHLICQENDKDKVYDYFINQPEVLEIIVNRPAVGARIIATK